ncbi:hypothetical protein EXW60_27545 [Bacillus mycoides]|nr:hypothetical protein EXW60_27545 [Bacillus mycoides]QWG93166.1 hypothetical protein EXW40_29650 [Bacillus mycoides]
MIQQRYRYFGRMCFKQKKRHPKVPSCDWNHRNMYWTPIQIIFYHVKLFCSLRNMIQIYIWG